jgi:hypothetical protein
LLEKSYISNSAHLVTVIKGKADKPIALWAEVL